MSSVADILQEFTKQNFLDSGYLLTKFRSFLIAEEFSVNEIRAVSTTLTLLEQFVKYKDTYLDTQQSTPVCDYDRAMGVVGK